MNAVEDLLGEALRARAGQRTATELPDAMRRVRHRIRRQRRRQAMVSTVGVVTTVATLLMLPAIGPARESSRRAGPAAGPAASAAVTPRPEIRLYKEDLKGNPPLGAVSKLTPPPGMRGFVTYVWLSATSSQPGIKFSVCHWVIQTVQGGSGGCDEYSHQPPAIKPVKVVSAIRSAGLGELHVGVADGTVASVTGLLNGGGETRGRLLLLGQPPNLTGWQFWQVGTSSPGSMHTIVFKDRSGKVIRTAKPMRFR